MTTRHAHLIPSDRVLQFITGGKSTFTVKNTTTGNRGTFRVERGDGEKDYEVRAFTGSDNSKKSEYTLFGWVRKDGTFLRYTPVAEFLDLRAEVLAKEPGSWLVGFLASWEKCLSQGAQPTERMQERYAKTLRKFGVPACMPSTPKAALLEKMFQWTWARAHAGLLPESVEVWHEGSCCYCSRPLTVPASIELGMGPDCAENRGFLPLWEALNNQKMLPLAA